MTTGPDHTPLIDEQLSAWLDDELPREELELLATRLARSSEYQARLARYSLISSSLRGELGGGRSGSHRSVKPGNLSSELAALQLGARVRATLDEPAGPERQPVPVRTTRMLPYAMAASLAVVAGAFAVLKGPLWRPAPEPVAVAGPVAVAEMVEPVRASLVSQVGSAGQASLSSRRLTNYLVYHGEYSGLLSARVTASHIVNGNAYAAPQKLVERLPNP